MMTALRIPSAIVKYGDNTTDYPIIVCWLTHNCSPRMVVCYLWDPLVGSTWARNPDEVISDNPPLAEVPADRMLRFTSML